MAKLQAKKIAEALRKAQQVGEVEVSFSITGCQVALRSLRPDEYESAMSSIGELEDIAYVQAYKLEHLSRSLAEFNSESLRGVDFVEIEIEETDNTTGRTTLKPVTLERHQFVKDHILATWSREAIDVAFRKFNDVVKKAEDTATENVKFEVPDETEDDKYRRLLGEAKAVEPAVPLELATKIRDEFGYLLKSEWTSADEKLAQVQVTSEGSRVVPEAEMAPLPDVPSRPVGPALQAPSNSAFLRPGVVVSPPAPSPEPASLRRSSEIEAAEALPGELGVSPQTAYNPHAEQRPQARNPEEAKAILDLPPTGGINPRFRPPPRV